MDRVRKAIPGVLAICLYILPIWYFMTHKGRQDYSGYSWWFGITVAMALVLVWIVPIIESRVAETIALVSLAGLQAVTVYLLESVVTRSDYAYVWLLLVLPATVWVALALMVNRASQWITPVAGTAKGQMAYGERMRMFASTGVTWLASAVVGALAATYLPFVRQALDDFMPFHLWMFSTGGVSLMATALVERRVKTSPDPRSVDVIKQKGVSEAIAREVVVALDRLSRLQLDSMLASGALGVLASWVVYLTLGHVADWLTLGLFFAGLLLSIAMAFAVTPWYRRRWHNEIQSNRFGVEQYQMAAEGTSLAFPHKEP